MQTVIAEAIFERVSWCYVTGDGLGSSRDEDGDLPKEETSAQWDEAAQKQTPPPVSRPLTELLRQLQGEPPLLNKWRWDNGMFLWRKWSWRFAHTLHTA